MLFCFFETSIPSQTRSWIKIDQEEINVFSELYGGNSIKYIGRNGRTFTHINEPLRYHPGKKNHHFCKFAIFRRLNRDHQELSFKKNSRKICFFCANLWSAKVFSMLIILIDCWQVLSNLIRVPLLNQANHAIWQKSWFTSIVLTVFPWSLKVNASKEEKRAYPFSYLP